MPETMILISVDDLKNTAAFIVMLMAKELTIDEIRIVRPDATPEYVEGLRNLISRGIKEIRSEIKKKKSETN